MATLQVTNLQNTAATVTNVSLLADGTTTLVLNATGTNRTGGLRYNAGNLEVYTSGGVWVAAGGGSGTVTGVTGTLPITVATGTSTPVIAINAATNAAAGSIEIATLAEAATGTDATRASTPETSVPKDASGMTGAALIPTGTTLQRPTPVAGMLRMNTTLNPDSLEVYDGTAAAWKQLAYETTTPAPPSLNITSNTSLSSGTYENVTIAVGVTVSVIGSVKLTVLGNFTNNGTIQGNGKGFAAGSIGGSQSGTNYVAWFGQPGQGPGGGPVSPIASPPVLISPSLNAGSGGSSGVVQTFSPDGGGQASGGAGGATFAVECAGTITLSSTSVISMSGANGSGTGTGASQTISAGGGGSGGTVYLSANTFNGQGTITATGGNGGTSDNRGGGGGGGYIIINGNTITDTSTKDVSGGAFGGGATASSGAGASNGGAGGYSSTAATSGQILTNVYL